jgi:hypothetical protein
MIPSKSCKATVEAAKRLDLFQALRGCAGSLFAQPLTGASAVEIADIDRLRDREGR